MSKLKSARDFAEELSQVAEGECPCAYCLFPLIEADSAAVALAAVESLNQMVELELENDKVAGRHLAGCPDHGNCDCAGIVREGAIRLAAKRDLLRELAADMEVRRALGVPLPIAITGALNFVREKYTRSTDQKPEVEPRAIELSSVWAGNNGRTCSVNLIETYPQQLVGAKWCSDQSGQLTFSVATFREFFTWVSNPTTKYSDGV